MPGVLRRPPPTRSPSATSTWELLRRHADFATDRGVFGRAERWGDEAVAPAGRFRWTDDYSNVPGVLRRPPPTRSPSATSTWELLRGHADFLTDRGVFGRAERWGDEAVAPAGRLRWTDDCSNGPGALRRPPPTRSPITTSTWELLRGHADFLTDRGVFGRAEPWGEAVAPAGRLRWTDDCSNVPGALRRSPRPNRTFPRAPAFVPEAAKA